jgi:UDPglucose 6-dehydrogenase
MGTGYVGLVAGACLSDSGNHVVCVDVNKDKVARLEKGEIPIFEPGLDEIVHRNIKAKRLRFTTNATEAIGSSKVVFIAVGTPSGEDGSLDLRYVREAIATVRDSVKEDAFIVLKSTVPVGTADMARDIIKGCRFKIDVISNPEFLKEGTAINDFLKPERVVIGCESQEARWLMGDLYSPYIRSCS